MHKYQRRFARLPQLMFGCSALISACATAGQWQEALEVFDSMKKAALSDPGCSPNTITYSSLISACAAGSRLDRALQVYDEMQEAGLEPDHITYSTLISAYEKAGELAEALGLLDKLHAAGGAASAETYIKIMEYLAGKQLWNRALEVFLELQAAGTICPQDLLPDSNALHAVVCNVSYCPDANFCQMCVAATAHACAAVAVHGVPVSLQLAANSCLVNLPAALCVQPH